MEVEAGDDQRKRWVILASKGLFCILTAMKFKTLLGLLPVMAFAHPDHDTKPGEAPAEGTLTGKGEWTFEAIPNWDDLPEGKNVGPTHGGVVVDNATGLVYAATDAAHGILVYKVDGGFVRSIAPECSGFHAMDLSVENGKTFLWGAQLGGPNRLRVCKLDTDGKLVMSISAKEYPDLIGGWNGLTSVAVAPDGTIFCSMGYGSQLIHKFDKTGKLLLSFGSRGDGEKVATKTCHGLKVDLRYGEPRLLICDRENRRLIHADFSGKWIGEYSTGLRRPCAVSILGDYCAVAELESRVTIIDKAGKQVAFLGDNPNKKQWAKFGVKPEDMKVNIFTAPHGLSFDKAGNLYVEDWNRTGRVTKLKKVKVEAGKKVEVEKKEVEAVPVK